MLAPDADICCCCLNLRLFFLHLCGFGVEELSFEVEEVVELVVAGGGGKGSVVEVDSMNN